MKKKKYKAALDNPAKSLNKYSKVPGREVNDKTSTKMKTSKLIGYILAAVPV